ncbi:MAG: hypothetical protein KDA79_13255 [Planctomycetaceae bacterium]|nr:hypothetical protein [Planctomycetaceae bacterium]
MRERNIKEENRAEIMRITELSALEVAIPLKKKIRHASFTRDANRTLLVCCRLEDGTVGWGEGLPRPYVTGETIDTAMQQFREADLARQLSGRIDTWGEAIGRCSELTLPGPADDDRGCFGNTVRCAIELSVLDAIGQRLGEPLSRVTAHVPEAAGLRELRKTVQYSGVITATSPLKERVSAWKMRLYGFDQIKVKVGAADQDDAATLGRIRRIVGAGRDLRIDANEAWRCDSLERKVTPLLPFGISSLEQPVPHAEVGGLAAWRGRIGVPLMLDESLCSFRDGERAVEQGTCDLFNLRLSKCGGFAATLRLAALAQRAGLRCQMGCQVGETGILSAAGRHFATSVAGLAYLEGSYDRHLVRERLTREDLTFQYGGTAPALERAGLGITIDESAVERVLVRREVVPFRQAGQPPASSEAAAY